MRFGFGDCQMFHKGKINFSICQTFCEVFFLRCFTGNLITDVISVWVKYSSYGILSYSNWLREKDSNLRPFGYEPNELTAATISRYIFYSKNFQNKSHKLNLIFSNNQISVGHFFVRLSSHLFHKVKTKFSFCQIYFMKLWLLGMFVLSDVRL